MKLSEAGLLTLMQHEAVVTNRYKDSVGVWTIGVGITAAAGASVNPDTFTGRITLEQAIEMFKETVKKYENGVNKAVTRDMPQHVFDAFTSFHYNTGAIGKASFVKDYNEGKSDKKVHDGMLKWRKPPEILERRKSEAKLFLTGEYPKGGISVYTASASGKVQWSWGQHIGYNTAAEMVRVA
jgi:lysozyme